MRQFYEDIIEKAGPPEWFDEDAVPRYGRFAPDRLANVYAREAALVRIRCRSCGQSFKVVLSRPNPSPVPALSIAELITIGQLSYGDPPNMKCCPKGAFSGSVAEKVLEYWCKSSPRKGWSRDPKFEIGLVPRAISDQPRGNVTVDDEARRKSAY